MRHDINLVTYQVANDPTAKCTIVFPWNAASSSYAMRDSRYIVAASQGCLDCSVLNTPQCGALTDQLPCAQRVKPATAAALETASDLSASAATAARQLARHGSTHGRALHRSASAKAADAWRGAGAGAAKLWKGAGPTAHGYAVAVQVTLSG